MPTTNTPAVAAMAATPGRRPAGQSDQSARRQVRLGARPRRRAATARGGLRGERVRDPRRRQSQAEAGEKGSHRPRALPQRPELPRRHQRGGHDDRRAARVKDVEQAVRGAEDEPRRPVATLARAGGGHAREEERRNEHVLGHRPGRVDEKRRIEPDQGADGHGGHGRQLGAQAPGAPRRGYGRDAGDQRVDGERRAIRRGRFGDQPGWARAAGCSCALMPTRRPVAWPATRESRSRAPGSGRRRGARVRPRRCEVGRGRCRAPGQADEQGVGRSGASPGRRMRGGSNSKSWYFAVGAS